MVTRGVTIITGYVVRRSEKSIETGKVGKTHQVLDLSNSSSMRLVLQQHVRPRLVVSGTLLAR